MNLQQFLDSERVQFSGSTFYTTTQVREWLKDHDTRLINKVLDEVKREVENCLLKQYAGRATNNKNATVWIERDVFKNDISTIIDQLKLK